MPQTLVSHTYCPICEKCFKPQEVTYSCPFCGPAGTLEMVYDFDRLREVISPAQIAARTAPADHSRWYSMWRYGSLLPVTDERYIPTLTVGWTPLIPAPRLAEAYGLAEVWLKDEGRNPTASLKDRASAMVVARARQIGAKVITTASTGNAAAALAGLCASVGMQCVIFVPATAPAAKIAQLLVYGATVLLVQGNYDDAYALSVQAVHEYGWYCRNTGMNPYTTEGKKTAALEIAEQLGWRAPDAVVISVGDGNIIAGQYKGFADLLALGWIDHLPRLIGVQAEGSANIVHAWERRLSMTQVAALPPGPSETIADSIAAGLPSDRVKALRAVYESKGVCLSVSDAAILAAIPELARLSGVFAEPAASATLAGLRKAMQSGAIRPGERVVLLITGSGLKDIRGAMQSIEGQSGHPVGREMGDVRRVVESLGLADHA